MRVPEVQRSRELVRIAGLPRRRWTDEQTQAAVAALTAEYRTASGTQTLFPVQARALWEARHIGGLLGPISVGGGKTLLLFLLARALGAKRPLILTLAELVEKTEGREWALYAQHWQIHPKPYVLSYQALGRVKAAARIEHYQPDVILCDEAHRLKNLKAACTRRVVRYMQEHPGTRFVAVSGTLISSSVADLAHLARFALRDGSPLPASAAEASEWAMALDVTRDETAMGVGALREFFVPGDDVGTLQDRARRGFADRLLSTYGVVGSDATDGVGASIRCGAVRYDVGEKTEEHFRRLREEWTTPDGWVHTRTLDVWQRARELALGFHNVWDPRPSPEWLRARSEYAGYVRQVLSGSRTLDSELMVRDAILAGARLPEPLWSQLSPMDLLRRWQAQAEIYKPNVVEIWHESNALEACAAWMKSHPHGIVWVEQPVFGCALARMTGAPFYWNKGLDYEGRPIEAESGKRAVIASRASNDTGRNLQQFSQNLVTCPIGNGRIWQQLIGRTHRTGQHADEVTIDVLYGCSEHVSSMERALESATFLRDTAREPQKLLLADVSIPVVLSTSPQWQAQSKIGPTKED